MIGVLAFQGDFLEHINIVLKLNKECFKIKTKEDLDKITHLIIPGGESTVIGKFLRQTALDLEIKKRVENNSLAIYGTCAGAILLANEVISEQKINNLSLIDAALKRNAFGSQIDSFTAELDFSPNSKTFSAVFIRAPKIVKYNQQACQVLVKKENEAVCLRQRRILISTFHPEISDFLDIHEYFITQI
jgi:5'-phosphate synthase pdxT subunit